MPEGRLYMTDATAEALGGREHVEQMYERIGDGGHIVIHSPLDSEEQVAFLFYMARIFSGADPFLQDSEKMPQVIEKAHAIDRPSFYYVDLDGNGTIDIGSYRYIPEYFNADTLIFPGEAELVRDFITAHELGHHKTQGRGGDEFRHIWRSETNADQDAFRGLGERATPEFQRNILAARAGNALHLHAIRMTYGTDRGENESFVHASVLGTFLPGEEPYEITDENVITAIDDFRAQIALKIQDNHAEENPGFEIDLSGLSTTRITQGDTLSNFSSFLEEKGPITQALYADFQQNLDDLSNQIGALENMAEMIPDNMAVADFERIISGPLYYQMKTEYLEALNFMRETNPEMFREYIAQNHSDLITAQTGFRPTGGNFEYDFQASNARMSEIVLQLDAEGAFDDNPVQRRLVDYIKIDMENRPELYAVPDVPAQPQQNAQMNVGTFRPS